MNRLLALRIAIAAFLLASLVPVAAASAAGEMPQASAEAMFKLGGDGFRFFVKARDDRVVLATLRRGQFVRYNARGKVTPSRVKARFGHLGRISVRFEPRQTKIWDPPEGCKGKPGAVKRGVFIGTIKLVGERGYVRLDAERARGTLLIVPRLRCNGPGPLPGLSSLDEEPELAGGRASLWASGPQERRLFIAEESRAAFTRFLGASFERRGSMRIIRGGFVPSARSRTFAFDEALTEAFVEPPKPFEGSASFLEDEDGSVTWRGSLSVSLLGADPIALAGPRFDVSLGSHLFGD